MICGQHNSLSGTANLTLPVMGSLWQVGRGYGWVETRQIYTARKRRPETSVAPLLQDRISTSDSLNSLGIPEGQTGIMQGGGLGNGRGREEGMTCFYANGVEK